MTIKEELSGVIAETAKRFRDDPKFVELEKFYAEMKLRGLVKKQEYSLPPIDTVGHSTFLSDQPARS